MKRIIRGLRLLAIRMKYMLYTNIYKMDIDPSARE